MKREGSRPIRKIDNTWILMPDGCRLAASIWLPVDADQDPVPAILEYLPYRKDDGTAIRDSTHHAYFASQGYASIRVDMRGSGASDGILYDEYLPQEQDDALEVLAWIAAQPWCTGAIGMIGISWGGFNGLQVAARRPPELKAVISICSTDDRYADDVHYWGGCLLASDMLAWASNMLAMNGLPPDPQVVGQRWREMWLDRLENTPPYVEAWMSHQTRDSFWKHGSVCEGFGDIVCPVYAVGGWADAYTNAIPRLLAGLPGPRKGLIGPWAHKYPQFGVPGPAIGFLQECLRWWDYWLKGIDTGIMDEPMLRAWMQDSVEPSSYYSERPGHWIAEPTWPAPDVEGRIYWLNHHSLDSVPAPETLLQFRGSQFAGLDGGVWCSYGGPVDLPPDQRMEDGLSLCFDSAPLEEPVELLGYPEVTLSLAADRPNGLLAVRLCDVAPTGSSLLISRGLLNLTHRDSHEFPTPLEPGVRTTATVQLNVLAHRLPAGHRVRVSVSPTYWPFAWPAPKPVTLSVFTGKGSWLALPVRAPKPKDHELAPFEPAEILESLKFEQLGSGSRSRVIRRDIGKSMLQIEDVWNGGRIRLLGNGIESFAKSMDLYSIVEDEPLSAAIRCDRTQGLQRGEWSVRVKTSSTMSGDAGTFYVTNVIDAFEGNTRVFTKAREFKVPRHWV